MGQKDQDGILTCWVVDSCSLSELEAHSEMIVSATPSLISQQHPHKVVFPQVASKGWEEKLEGLWRFKLEGHIVSPLPPSVAQSKSQGSSRFERWRISLHVLRDEFS